VTHKGVEVILMALCDFLALLLYLRVLGSAGVHAVLADEIIFRGEVIPDGGKLLGSQVGHGKFLPLLRLLCARSAASHPSVWVKAKNVIGIF